MAMGNLPPLAYRDQNEGGTTSSAAGHVWVIFHHSEPRWCRDEGTMAFAEAYRIWYPEPDAIGGG